MVSFTSINRTGVYKSFSLLPPTLFSVYLHISEHIWIVTYPEVLSASSGYISENDFPGYNVGKLLLVRIILHLWIDIFKNGWAIVIRRILRIIDTKVFNGDAVRHITGIAEIMLS